MLYVRLLRKDMRYLRFKLVLFSKKSFSVIFFQEYSFLYAFEGGPFHNRSHMGV